MKKRSVALAALMAVVSVAGLTACNNNPEDGGSGEHQHEWLRHAKLSVAATCGAAGVDVMVCSDCDETYTVSVPATGNHTYGNNHVCDVCGYIDMSEMTEAAAIAEYGFYFVDKDNSKTYTAGDEIKFGSYPQNLTSDETALAALSAYEQIDSNWSSYGYYAEGEQADYMLYRDVEVDGARYRGVYLEKYRPYYFNAEATADNSYIDDQNYELEEVYWFEYAPITWAVLGYEGGRILLNSKYCLEGQPFNATFKGDSLETLTTVDGKRLNDWETSTLRTFLNEDFYDLAFSEAQQKLIPEVTLDNQTSVLNNDMSYNNTDDKVFLLSYKDMLNTDYGFDGNSARSRSYTAYSTIQGLRPSTEAVTADNEPACSYMLRSKANSDYTISCVSKQGTASAQPQPIKLDGASYDGFAVNGNLGVLPSLYIKVGPVEWEEHTWEYKTASNEDATLDYALCFPKSYSEDGDPLPLITFIPDASYQGKDMASVQKAPVPTYWVTEEMMEKYPAVYLITTFTKNASGNQIEALQNPNSEESQVINIIDSVCKDYNVNTDKLYLTGQSMGGIFDFAVNTIYPDKFAATVYVACQPGGEVSTEEAPVEMYDYIIEQAKFVNQKFIYIASRKDPKAPYGQNDVEAVLNGAGLVAGTDYYKNYELDPTDPAGSSRTLQAAFAQNYSQYFIGFPQVAQGGNEEHMASFPICYQVEALLSWLLSQSL